MSGSTSRNKGKRGELELANLIADLSGWDVRRKVRQHDGDQDLEGIPGWAPEVKRHKSAGRGLKAAWWAQAIAQATSLLPVLFYRTDRDEWRAVYPAATLLQIQHADMWSDYKWTIESSVECWVTAAREVNFLKGL